MAKKFFDIQSTNGKEVHSVWIEGHDFSCTCKWCSFYGLSKRNMIGGRVKPCKHVKAAFKMAEIKPETRLKLGQGIKYELSTKEPRK